MNYLLSYNKRRRNAKRLNDFPNDRKEKPQRVSGDGAQGEVKENARVRPSAKRKKTGVDVTACDQGRNATAYRL